MDLTDDAMAEAVLDALSPKRYPLAQAVCLLPGDTFNISVTGRGETYRFCCTEAQTTYGIEIDVDGSVTLIIDKEKL